MLQSWVNLTIINQIIVIINPFSATRSYKRHQDRVKAKGLGRNSSYLAGVSIFFFHGSMKKFIRLAKKKLLEIFLSSIKTKVTIKFPTKLFFFFSAKNWLGSERVNCYLRHVFVGQGCNSGLIRD